ncbi:hypothetical protein Glove_230g204 [Diversispora epigaea]|uniref:Glycosyl transferase family 25 domain-containing protein n=1 Tax=Diversispora epigaea TaxID=1348612 RepID=A0A397IIN5_9GLOM|nr:hypothetical protein Glove_230g204 [Diversispora epigaea]
MKATLKKFTQLKTIFFIMLLSTILCIQLYNSNDFRLSFSTTKKNRPGTFHFDKIYVLNLKRRSDRREKMSLLLDYFNLEYEFFPAFDANSPEVEKEYQSVIKQSKLRKSEIACTLSHLKIYQSIINNNLKSALIFEDDIDLEVDIELQINEILPYLPKDWEMFYIGHCCVEDLREPFNYPTLFISTRPSCTHAYAVSNIGAQKLLSILVKLNNPLDCVLVDLIEAGKIKSFSVEPPLAVQWRLGMGSDIAVSDPSWVDQQLKNSTLKYLSIKD